MHAETAAVVDWWARPRGTKVVEWVADYQQSVTAPYRGTLATVMAGLQPETVLEIGCHCGPNLMRFAQEMPELRMLGVDASAEAIEAGKLWVETGGLTSRIRLSAGCFPAVTNRLVSGVVDVVLSCYSLAYMAPADLPEALYEMGRLAGKALVIAEPMAQGAPVWETSLTGYQIWHHDYRAALQWAASCAGMTIQSLPIQGPDSLNGLLVATR